MRPEMRVNWIELSIQIQKQSEEDDDTTKLIQGMQSLITEIKML
jgi:hypothetical protein